ncbi:hypothetical protein BABINDRAFT_35970 [Babjeviella inositovora NRRL Y-12698]|uniref:non-specific serine/threonine protein kinase n=1 Tax=Babjeviella inositovora NRRL Y-12698 TaxID=984486 RepID=A0A1E3QRE6_9ASCO|nr:uncharacterized protein BABINDRAFT_35970 [Babjeviella inositovora NRRL Y-12698]ODQ80251.1 hypothetical protein BABINDRAFT_35970 [Babjeviella inositovora NRRL Y-12698]
MNSQSPRDLFLLHECVGKGNFGDVYRATEKSTNRIVAVKIVDLDESDEDINILIQEVQFLSQLKSPYITGYFNTYIQDVSMWISMEYCGGGSCADLLKCHRKLDETAVAYITRDVLRGLEYLHLQQKVHRDVKAANILLTANGGVKLADFGVSGQLSYTQVKRDTFVGTPFWMAPEVILRKAGYNEKADIWSLGITVIELAKGVPPHVGGEPMKVLFQIPSMPAPLLEDDPHGTAYSDLIKDFIKYCLVKNPAKRPSTTTLLRHKYFRSILRKYTLVPLIQQKDRWLAKNSKISKSKRPRLSLDYDPTPLNPIDWRLTENCQSGSTPNSGGVSPLTPKTSGGTSPCTSTPPQKDENRKEDHSCSLSLDGNVILACLNRVASRAKTEETKVSVLELGRVLHSYESRQPGLCEAIAEEICLYVHKHREFL